MTAPAATPPQTSADDEEWIPLPGRRIRIVGHYNPRTHTIRITQRWHGERVTEECQLPPFVGDEKANQP